MWDTRNSQYDYSNFPQEAGAATELAFYVCLLSLGGGNWQMEPLGTLFSSCQAMTATSWWQGETTCAPLLKYLWITGWAPCSSLSVCGPQWTLKLTSQPLSYFSTEQRLRFLLESKKPALSPTFWSESWQEKGWGRRNQPGIEGRRRNAS